MARVDVYAVPGHTGSVVPYENRSESKLWRPVCICGWAGPSYPHNDKGTAEIGLTAHCATAPALKANFFTDVWRVGWSGMPGTVTEETRRKPIWWPG